MCCADQTGEYLIIPFGPLINTKIPIKIIDITKNKGDIYTNHFDHLRDRYVSDYDHRMIVSTVYKIKPITPLPEYLFYSANEYRDYYKICNTIPV